jgi:chromosome segregation ATPase
MTEQEIKQENEKLKARLNKAVEVFKEQKENIDRLTAERDKAQADCTILTERVKTLEAKFEEKSEQDDKFFDQLNEIQQLEDKNKELQEKYDNCMGDLADVTTERDKYDAENTELAKELEDANKTIEEKDETISEHEANILDKEARIAALENTAETHRKTMNEQQGTINEQKGTIENLNNALAKLNEQIQTERKNFEKLKANVIKLFDENSPE